MVKSLMERIIYWLNGFPSDIGISSTTSPAAIIEGSPHPDFSQKHIAFGAYSMVHTVTVNNTKARDIPAITLKPLNESGWYTFMSLLSGKKIRGAKWTQKHIPGEVIACVEYLATCENMPLLDSRELIFEWAPGQNFGPTHNFSDNSNVDVDDIKNNGENDEVVDHNFEDNDSDDEVPSQPSDNESDDKHATNETDQVIFDNFEVFNERLDNILDDLNQSNYDASTYNENDITSDEDKYNFDAYTPICTMPMMWLGECVCV